MLEFTQTGDFKKTEQFLSKLSKPSIASILDKYGRMGVAALANATPYTTGHAASSWSYEVKISRSEYSITWSNSDVENGFPVVIMLQYGHGTGTGGYIQGQDFINPALKPVMDKLADEVWKVVTSA